MPLSNIHRPQNTDLAERDAIELMDTTMTWNMAIEAAARKAEQVSRLEQQPKFKSLAADIAGMIRALRREE